ncbi:SDR family NAD(P)-dependent oxidoreductase [Pseudarthrobacter enclensis]|uniref:NAD(P)-dependent dehydrogenase (Short-subunit alcohol dehydrogenase family) n=1 Tax=Pseudarthrobacter enclensis TaxID=993070 RepID=A0ABT9RV33_9MICC|nr:SDR family NAD(P)-dependent oxidoreductase [Pseudarthrobacter enclensis]MDP9889096.1 NAD(P)-dependent dehydrogenase (short-subunit alcohol dehydrogenase family) [Pseudarthrobacter enclensis]
MSLSSEPEGKVALVVGGAGAVGRAVCRRFVEEGYAVVIADARGLDAAKSSLGRHASRVKDLIEVDLREENSVAAMGRRLEQSGSLIDALVIVAGVQQPAATVLKLETSDWDHVMDVNLRGPFLVCKHILPRLTPHSSSSVVIVGSFWAYEGHAFFSAYCASKAGLRVFTQSLAAEMAPSGIRVNMVAPGNIDTPMHHNAIEAEAAERGISVDEMRSLEWAKIPMGKPADPLEIADAVNFLVGASASYITGSSIDVNGGVVFR